jgi:hydrogenase expression/formation protein HypD
MKYLDEYRDPAAADKLRQALRTITTKPWTIMEVCGGQTHTIVKYGIDELLPPGIELVHGPGCPVCVTPLELIDKAIAIASRPEVIFCSFGDMLRVPGSRRDLFAVKAAGGDVRVVYSPLDCLRIAEQNPTRTTVFFAVGFETTAPANAMAVLQAKRRAFKNFAVARVPCFGAAGDDGHSFFRHQPRAGFPGRRPRVYCHGLRRVFAACRTF